MKKYNLYLGGGAMSGVFGAGFLSILEEANFYKNIKAIYCVSCGGFNGAYFLTHQTSLGSRIYWENLNKEFIKPRRIIFNLFHYLFHKLVPRSWFNFLNIVEVDHLMNIIKNDKILDISRLKKSKIPIYVKLLDTKTGKLGYYDLRINTLYRLKAGIGVLPYYYDKKLHHLDGGIFEPFGIKKLSKRVKGKFIVCMNYSPEHIHEKFRNFFRDFVESRLTQVFYDISFKKFFKDRIKNYRQDLNSIRYDSSIILVAPPISNPSHPLTTDPDKLKDSYELGRRGAKRILKSLEYNNI